MFLQLILLHLLKMRMLMQKIPFVDQKISTKIWNFCIEPATSIGKSDFHSSEFVL